MDEALTAKLPPLLFPAADYYLRLLQGAEIDYHCRYDKRAKGTHRYDIADTRGRLSLTVPVSSPAHIVTDGAPLTWQHIAISDHGQWWAKHLTALESAYGRTPYFEFYIDRFAPLLDSTTPQHYPSVAALVEAANTIVLPILALDQFRPDAPAEIHPIEYPQIRADRLGFIPGLSILDMIFNLGPETPLYLRQMIK